MALDALTARIGFRVDLNAGRTVTGAGVLAINPVASKTLTFTLGTGALAANNAYCAVTTIASSGNTTLDLNGSLTNICGSASMALVRAKTLLVWLLGTGDTAPDGSTTGTAATSITIGNGTNPQGFGFDAATDTWTIFNGDFFLATRSDATGWAITGAASDTLKIVNNDSGNSAKILVAVIGADS